MRNKIFPLLNETNYHENFKKWLTRFQREDLVAACAQTDTKGDRMLRPAEQPNPGAYVRIKERLKDGIVVEGCKLHISEASVSDEIIVLPTRALRADDSDYAVAFAVPGDWDGMTQVVTIHNFRTREHYKRGFMPGYTDSYLIFDNCFIPWERVFLAGEHMHGGILALLFALFHRHSYSGCKPAIGDVILGQAALAAEEPPLEPEDTKPQAVPAPVEALQQLAADEPPVDPFVDTTPRDAIFSSGAPTRVALVAVVMVGAVDGVTLHVFERVVHEAHVPLEAEAQPALIGWLRDLRP